MKKNMLFSIALILLGLFACEEAPESVTPCTDTEWAKALKNGKETCWGEVAVSYFNPNTKAAVIVFTAGDVYKSEISAEFTIPEEGVNTNTDYPLKSGTVFGADPLTSGTINFIDFDPPAPGKKGCITGTFNLTAGVPGVPTTFTYTNGTFIFYRGTMFESDHDTGEACNPFK